MEKASERVVDAWMNNCQALEDLLAHCQMLVADLAGRTDDDVSAPVNEIDCEIAPRPGCKSWKNHTQALLELESALDSMRLSGRLQ